MFRKTGLWVLSFSLLAAAAVIIGCSSGGFMGAGGASQGGTAPVSLSMTDDPPQGVSVLFFQVDLTAASLQATDGTSVSLLANDTPVQIDVTKLQALAAFLSTKDVAVGTYNSLSLTFANPQLVIYNSSNTSLGADCAVGTVCELTPTVANATVTLNSSPFPVTVESGTPLGFLVDFHLNKIIQPDLSVDLRVANGVTISTLPKTKPHYGFLGGAVTAVDAANNQFSVKTIWGRTFTVKAAASTTFTNFPADSCATPALSCVQTGDIVLVQVSGIEGKGVVDAAQVGYVANVADLTVEGTIVDVTPAAEDGSTPAGFKLLLHDVTTADASIDVKLPRGSKAKVTVAADAAFTVDNQGFVLPTDVSFASAADLTVGQEVQVKVAPDTVVASTTTQNFGHWGPPPTPSFTVSAVQLEPSQISGLVDTVSTSGFTLDNWPSFYGWWWLQPKVKANVETTTATTFTGFTSADLTGVTAGDVVSVNGWLFATPPAPATTSSKAGSIQAKPAWSHDNSTPPTVVGQTVTLHANHWF